MKYFVDYLQHNYDDSPLYLFDSGYGDVGFTDFQSAFYFFFSSGSCGAGRTYEAKQETSGDCSKYDVGHFKFKKKSLKTYRLCVCMDELWTYYVYIDHNANKD